MDYNYLKYKKILIVDDEVGLLEMVTSILEQDGFKEIKTAGTVSEALSVCKAWNPEIAVLDVMLPDGNGFSLFEQMRAFTEIPVLFLTARGEDEDKLKGLGLGADDYMTKPFGILELSARVRNLLKRSGTVREESTCLAAGDVKIDKETREVVSCGEKVELTLKEFELLSYLMEHMNRVVTRDELLDNIWGYDYDGETRTLDMHIKTLRQKLKDAGQQIKTVRGVGYRFLKEKER